jgi:hypothetical protein
MVRVISIVAILLTLFASSGTAPEHQHPENGKRLGTVYFATSCNDAAQKEFNRAVALLHSFQFSRAIEGFDGALHEDATCAGESRLAIGVTPLHRARKTGASCRQGGRTRNAPRR